MNELSWTIKFEITRVGLICLSEVFPAKTVSQDKSNKKDIRRISLEKVFIKSP